MADRIEPRLFRGSKDFLPEEMIPWSRLIDVLRAVFERFGFAPLSTPAIEYLDILLGKYGVEGEKLIYRLEYKGGNVAALRYDLTVPLSRVVAMHRDLPRPFKRYQIQPVWRADTPQLEKGRFREFTQCDVDTIGTSSLLADAENVAVVHAALKEVGLPSFRIRINHRKLLKALVLHAGIAAERGKDVCRAIDKLDKTSKEEVIAELSKAGIGAAEIDRLFAAIMLGERTGAGSGGNPRDLVKILVDAIGDTPSAKEALAEMDELLARASDLGVPDDVMSFDLYLTRGLDYYTGPVYEVQALGIPGFGSLGGGGRYDDLIGMYGKEEVPATGVSIGLSRVFEALQRQNLLERRITPTRVLVVRFGDAMTPAASALVREIREGGIPAEIYPDNDRLKKQLEYAARKEIPLVAILGEDEVKAGVVTLKDMRKGEQQKVPRASLIGAIRTLLS